MNSGIELQLLKIISRLEKENKELKEENIILREELTHNDKLSSKGTLLRYINFDRKTKEYIFIEGSNKQVGELAIRVKRAEYIKGRVEKLYHIGNANTDQYLSTPRLIKLGV